MVIQERPGRLGGKSPWQYGITFTKLRAKGKYENETRNIHVILDEVAQAKMPKDLLITIWSCNEWLRMGDIRITHHSSWSRRIDKYHIEASIFLYRWNVQRANHRSMTLVSKEPRIGKSAKS